MPSVSSPPRPSISAIATLAPLRANAIEVARPIPDAPPVTSTTLSCRFMSGPPSPSPPLDPEDGMGRIDVSLAMVGLFCENWLECGEGEFRTMPQQLKSGSNKEPLTIAEQGSFFVGGRTVTAAGAFDPARFFLPFSSEGQTYSIEHLYAQYQIPPNARRMPIVMVHGGCQSGKTWESTPDGR